MVGEGAAATGQGENRQHVSMLVCPSPPGGADIGGVCWFLIRGEGRSGSRGWARGMA